MKSTSAKFKQVMAAGGTRNYVVKIYITFADGTTLPNNDPLTEEDIWMDSFKIETASSGQSSFDIGSAIIGQCKFQLNNWDERFNQYDFFNAQAVVWVGLVGDETNNTQNYIRMGFFTVDEPTFSGALVNLTLLDNMWKFDVPLYEVNITYDSSTKALDIVQAICTYCGVTLATQTFHGYNFPITKAPDSADDMNCREMLQYIAMIGCNFCVIDDTGSLRLRWYDTASAQESELNGGSFSTNTTPYSDGDSADGGNFTNYTGGTNYNGGSFLGNTSVAYFSRNFQTQIGTDEITITGVKFTINDVDHRIGTTGYVLELENPLVNENNVNSALNSIWSVLNGFKLRTFNIQPVSDLSCEVGDSCIITTLKGTLVNSYITYNSFGFTDQTVECNAISQTRTLTKRYSKAVQAVVEEARRQAENAISDYDLAVQMMNNLAVNAMGGYQEYEDAPTGGRLYYLSNKPITKDAQTGHCSFQSGSTVFKMSGDGFFVSIDGGTTWTNGYNAQTGNLVVNVLNAIGLSAEWVKTGTLDVGGNGTNAVIRVKDSSNNVICTIDNRGIIMSKGALESDDYSYTSGHFSDDGTRFDVTNDYLRSKYFAFDENGAYINGQVEADSGKIGAATITHDSIKIIGNVELYSGSGTFQFRPTDYYFADDFKLTLHTEGTCTVTLVKHQSGSDTTVGTYSVTSSTDVETATLDHTIGTNPDDYYLIEVSGSSCVVSAYDVILAYMGEEGFLGTLRGLFYGYLKSKSGTINDLSYKGDGTFYGDDMGIVNNSQWIRLFPNPTGGVPAIRRYYYDSNNVLHNDRVVWSGENLAYQNDIAYFKNIGFGTENPSDPAGAIPQDGTLYFKNNGFEITNIYQAENGNWLEYIFPSFNIVPASSTDDSDISSGSTKNVIQFNTSVFDVSEEGTSIAFHGCLNFNFTATSSSGYVSVKYSVDGILLETMTQQYASGTHILTLNYLMNNLTSGTHILVVSVECTGGSISNNDIVSAFIEGKLKGNAPSPSTSIIIYRDGRIINNNSITDTSQAMSNFYNDGSGAVTNTDGKLEFVEYPSANQQWRNSYIRTGINVNANDELRFHVKDNLHDYADNITIITANDDGEILLCFDCYHWDSLDPRNIGNYCSVLIWDGTGTPNTVKQNNNPNLPSISGHDDYGAGVARPSIKISDITVTVGS